ncbi:MAG: FAD-binding oxidoreductase [Planctomycetes bacterium]|nr:FAD-binding oxidoreductase [Planctomycetota bacterium]
MRPRAPAAGPLRSWELVEGWGMAVAAPARVLRPRGVDEIRAAFAQARRDGVPLGLRGGGNSYGDAALNSRGHVLDISRMDRVLRWDPATGLAELEPGVTVRQLWQRSLPDGWWPRVVSGTMFPTMAGALAMNVHGKNNFAAGTFGEACVEFDLVLPSGEVRTASRERDPDLFHAAIGGLGLLGCFSRVVLHTHRVHSGDLLVKALRGRDLREVMQLMEQRRATSDYLVGWLDGFPRGEAAGRGLVHAARYLRPGEDADPRRTLAVGYQELPPYVLGFPKAEVWRVLRRLNNDAGMRAVNAAKWLAGRVEAAQNPYRQPLAAFSFLLDYVPNWKYAYGTEPGRHGLIQFQSFVPHAAAHDTFLELLARCRGERLVPYLLVLKRHRPDPFWLTHAVDGWSLAMDFKLTPDNRARLFAHARAMAELVLAAGGRFYGAKDLVLGAGALARFIPTAELQRFLDLKRRLDPEGLLQTDLSRRLLAGLLPGAPGA